MKDDVTSANRRTAPAIAMRWARINGLKTAVLLGGLSALIILAGQSTPPCKLGRLLGRINSPRRAR